MTAPARRAAVFLDKDGTLVENVPYSADPGEMRLTPGAGEACRALNRHGFALVVVSNQSGVARGLFDEDALITVESRLRTLLGRHGATLEDFIYCPHHPEGSVTAYRQACRCRKPRPGMLFDAAERHRLDLSRSWMVGDILDDVEAGTRAGCRSILIDNGNETEWITAGERRPDFRVPDLPSAAAIITSASTDNAEAAG